MGVVEGMLWSTFSFICNGTSNLQEINRATAGRSDSEISLRHQRSRISAEYRSLLRLQAASAESKTAFQTHHLAKQRVDLISQQEGNLYLLRSWVSKSSCSGGPQPLYGQSSCG